jgi:hypothetical protein
MARDQRKDDSVFDFLYIDSRRIALFLSQFDKYGHLKSLTRSVGENSKTGGGFDLKVVKADYSEGEDSSLKKEYDAQWVAPLTFLDHVQRRDMLERDITKAGIGNLVLTSGALSVRDLRLIMSMMALPSMKQNILQKAAPSTPPDTRGRNERRHSPRAAPEPVADHNAIGLDMMTVLPHGTQAMLISNESQVWSALRDDCLIVPASELFLSHGVDIPGKWNILGILDARPDEEESQRSPEDQMAGAQAAIPSTEIDGVITLVTQGFGGFIDGIAPMARLMMGRRTSAYGLTPILIFREVSGGSD